MHDSCQLPYVCQVACVFKPSQCYLQPTQPFTLTEMLASGVSADLINSCSSFRFSLIFCAHSFPVKCLRTSSGFHKSPLSSTEWKQWWSTNGTTCQPSTRTRAEKSTVSALLSVNEKYVSGQGRNVTLAHKHINWVYTTMCCGDT